MFLLGGAEAAGLGSNITARIVSTGGRRALREIDEGEYGEVVVVAPAATAAAGTPTAIAQAEKQ